MGWYDCHEPKELIGKTLRNVIVDYENNEIELYFSDKTLATFFHKQDCCEDVRIKSSELEVSYLKLHIGQTLTNCYLESKREMINYGSETLTTLYFWFGSELVKIVWKGKSNGCYSEGVDLRLTEIK